MEEEEEEAPVEEEEEDEVQVVEEDDDVVIKAEPVVQIVVEDDVETDEETEQERAARDADPIFPSFNSIKIKQEPIDPGMSLFYYYSYYVDLNSMLYKTYQLEILAQVFGF